MFPDNDRHAAFVTMNADGEEPPNRQSGAAQWSDPGEEGESRDLGPAILRQECGAAERAIAVGA